MIRKIVLVATEKTIAIGTNTTEIVGRGRAKNRTGEKLARPSNTLTEAVKQRLTTNLFKFLPPTHPANQWFETRGEPARTLNQSEASPWLCILCLPHYLKSLSQYLFRTMYIYLHACKSF